MEEVRIRRNTLKSPLWKCPDSWNQYRKYGPNLSRDHMFNKSIRKLGSFVDLPIWAYSQSEQVSVITLVIYGGIVDHLYCFCVHCFSFHSFGGWVWLTSYLVRLTVPPWIDPSCQLSSYSFLQLFVCSCPVIGLATEPHDGTFGFISTISTNRSSSHSLLNCDTGSWCRSVIPFSIEVTKGKLKILLTT